MGGYPRAGPTQALDGPVRWDDVLFGYTIGHADLDRARDDRDSAPFLRGAMGVPDIATVAWSPYHHTQLFRPDAAEERVP